MILNNEYNHLEIGYRFSIYSKQLVKTIRIEEEMCWKLNYQKNTIWLLTPTMHVLNKEIKLHLLYEL